MKGKPPKLEHSRKAPNLPRLLLIRVPLNPRAALRCLDDGQTVPMQLYPRNGKTPDFDGTSVIGGISQRPKCQAKDMG
jgi:hypothetical protein